MTAKKVIRCLSGMFWYGFAGIVVLTAVLLTVARLLLPLAENYRVEAEQALSEYAGQKIRVANLTAQWAGFEPQLHFSDVRLYDKDSDVVLFQFKDARMGIDLFSSIGNRDFVPSSFTVSGISLSVTRNADESISIDGLSDENIKSEQDYSGLLFEWLMRQPNIGVESSSITWTDIPLNHKKLLFKDVNLRLRNYDDVHQVDGNVSLPKNLGNKITVAAELQGSEKELSSWHGDIYMKAEALSIPGWWREPLLQGVSLSAGATDFEVWGKWKNNALQDLEGILSLSGLAFSGEHAKAIKFTGLNTVLSWHQSDSDISLHLENFAPTTADGAWPASRVSFLANQVTERLAVVADYVQLSDVLPLVNVVDILNEEQVDALKAVRPSAKFNKLSLVLSTDKDVTQWYVDGRFLDLSTQAWNDLPRLAGLSGNFVIDNNQGSLKLDSNNVVIDASGLFRKPIDLSRLAGQIQWKKDESGLSLQATDFGLVNADITLYGQMDLLLPNKGSPVIDLLAEFENADGGKTYKYLPVPVLSEKTIAWLDKSIIQGTIPSGRVILHGPLDKFPFDHGEGKFETRFDVVNAKLDYESGWPAISEMQGEVIFSGRSLDIIGKSGRILDAKVHDVTAHVADLELDDPMLELRGEVKTSTQNLIEYVVASNLAESYGEALRKLKSTGDTALKLDINIPMTSGKGTVNGEAVLKDVNLSIQKSKVKLQDVNGKVQVSNDGLWGKGIKGRLFKTPVSIELSHDDDASTALSIKAKGDFDLNKLLKDEFNKEIPTISTGKTEWLANLSFRNPKGATHPVVLELDSELQGVDITLPAPFGKVANAVKPLKLISRIRDDGEIQLEADLGDDISSIIHLQSGDNGIKYAGSSIAFGDELPVPPDNKRLSITGQLDALSVNEWMAYVEESDWANKAQQKNASLEWLEHVNLQVASVAALGSHFNVKRIRLEREAEYWHADIDADRMKGHIEIPYDLSVEPIKSTLNWLKLQRIENDNDDISADPRELPGLLLSIDQFVFDDVALGSLNMTTVKTDKGLVMNNLVISGADTELTASGQWQVENDEQVTQLTAKLKTERFSDLLTDLGYSTGFDAGKSSNKAALEWRGNPLQFSVGKLNGSMKIKISKGQLADVSPGAGRIFGLLSLQALPRRLTLDFSDLFKKGFSFDRIKGNFLIEQGDAYTTDLYLDGPAARIDVSGRAGLTTRDYDQLITVTPDLTGSLPLAGALLGGPIAGGVVFALDKLLRPAIDDITRYQYTVTGSWDDPQVEPLDSVAVDSSKAN